MSSEQTTGVWCIGGFVSDAAIAILAVRLRPMTAAEITFLLDQYGYPFVSEDHEAAVTNALRRVRHESGYVKTVRKQGYVGVRWLLSHWLVQSDEDYYFQPGPQDVIQ